MCVGGGPAPAPACGALTGRAPDGWEARGGAPGRGTARTAGPTRDATRAGYGSVTTGGPEPMRTGPGTDECGDGRVRGYGPARMPSRLMARADRSASPYLIPAASQAALYSGVQISAALYTWSAMIVLATFSSVTTCASYNRAGMPLNSPERLST